MRLEAKHFFSLAVVSISAEPISVFCGVNTNCVCHLMDCLVLTPTSPCANYGYRSTEDKFKSTYAVKAKTFSLTDIARLY
jgi:hypothetical protein